MSWAGRRAPTTSFGALAAGAGRAAAPAPAQRAGTTPRAAERARATGAPCRMPRQPTAAACSRLQARQECAPPPSPAPHGCMYFKDGLDGVPSGTHSHSHPPCLPDAAAACTSRTSWTACSTAAATPAWAPSRCPPPGPRPATCSASPPVRAVEGRRCAMPLHCCCQGASQPPVQLPRLWGQGLCGRWGPVWAVVGGSIPLARP